VLVHGRGRDHGEGEASTAASSCASMDKEWGNRKGEGGSPPSGWRFSAKIGPFGRYMNFISN
jgi:hypothetical protein